MADILELLGPFTPAQRAAVADELLPLAVTASAGSGKTRTLVGRYLVLLAEGHPPEQVIAITFTDKAAREMRTRIRAVIERILAHEPVEAGPDWAAVYTALDAAPIGTIHSLCSTILRSHAAEAGIDPGFAVLDEGQAAVLRSEAVEAALAWAAEDGGAVRLFSRFDERSLRSTLAALLARRHDAAAAFAALGEAPLATWRALERTCLAEFIDHAEVMAVTSDLAELARDGTLARTADPLAIAIGAFLPAWAAVASAWADHDLPKVVEHLLDARRASPRGNLGRAGSWPDVTVPRELCATWRRHYDATIAPLGIVAGDADRDIALAEALPLLNAAFEQARASYRQARALRRAMDFDDLEASAADLLTMHSGVRAAWRARTQAVLVDEFQDTNARQQRIVYALAGLTAEGRTPSVGEADATCPLFVVGDARQSIYRFRGADVTVFGQVQQDVVAAGGQVVDLDVTFRAHSALVAQLNALLADDRPGTAGLIAHRPAPTTGAQPPFVTFCVGLGATVGDSRPAVARALADRLGALQRDEGIRWQDMGLLFRASTGFPAFEDALAAAGIPFVTVAGRGFYQRPEVRDVLNALRAIADPTDDVALAGLLRSPACALSDAALYQLRGSHKAKRGLWAALADAETLLSAADAIAAERARALLDELHTLAGRLTVAELITRFLERTHYRAILGSAAGNGSPGDRALRNVDKLLADAYASRLVSVGAFLAHLQALRDVAAREGEAPAEAGDAVQLMTIHKAKGLEFPVVVLADATRQVRSGSEGLLVDAQLGPVPDLRLADERPLVRRLATHRQQSAEEAESARLLYVAATRAMDKLIICGTAKLGTGKESTGRLQLTGWLATLGQVAGLADVQLATMPAVDVTVELSPLAGSPVDCHIAVPAGDDLPLPAFPPPASLPASSLAAWGRVGEGVIEPPSPLVAPLRPVPAELADDRLRAREADSPLRVWRVVPTAERSRAPAWVVGQLVHATLARWCFPANAGFAPLVRHGALAAGLIDTNAVADAEREVSRLLLRFQAHPLYARLNRVERWHEVPFSWQHSGQKDSGIVDLLARDHGEWLIVEFKTDRLADADQLAAKVAEYSAQMQRYTAAVSELLGAAPSAELCFLDALSSVQVERMSI